MVLDLDPDAAARRKEAGRRNAHVQTFREPSGNAGMIARELPSDEVLASWQHIEQRALDLRAAGIPGTLEELRVRAYLDLLQERRTRLPVPRPGPAGTPATAGPQDTGPDRKRRRPRRSAGGPGGSGPAGGPGGTVRPRSRGRPGWQRLRRPARRGCRAEPGRAGHHHRAVVHADRPVRQPRPRSAGTAPSTPPTPATWPPRPPVTPAPGGASPRCTPTAPPPPTAAHPEGTPAPGPAPAAAPGPGPDPPPGTRPQDWISRLRIG